MTFHIDQRVAYPAFGLGRVVGLVMKAFPNAEQEEFYEVVGEHSTMWVPVSVAASRGLRRLTHEAELPVYRSLLRGQPGELSPDARLRQRDVLARIKRGRLQDLCEVVRDLNGYGWHAALNEYDVVELKKSQHWLCQEWAAASSLSLDQATAEVMALLVDAHRAHAGAPPAPRPKTALD